MKKCPNCQREFPDTMRFCQTDGTPLVEVAAPAAEDPLKTTVVRQEEIASAIPPDDPYKTVVGGQFGADESGDLLQLPEEVDPLKTMIAAPIVREEKPVLEEPRPEPPKFEEIRNEIKAETPSAPAGGFAVPSEPLPEASPDFSDDQTVFQPEPPKFNEPSLSPPNFGDLGGREDREENLAATMIQDQWSPPPADNSPFARPDQTPAASNDLSSPSPFAPPPAATPSPFDPPASPFGSPADPWSSAPVAEQTPAFDPPTSYQESPATQFGGAQFDQMSQDFGASAPMQSSGWTPPAPPEQSWGGQNLGANTPFQPPPAGVGGGQNQTLAIVSLVLGVLSIFCCGWLIPGIAAVVLGFMAKSKAEQNPAEYGGRGLAIGGIVTGGISIVLGIILVILYLIGGLASMMN